MAERARAAGRVWREEDITLADIDWALALNAQIVALHGPAYLHTYRRLKEERDRRREEADLMAEARALAGR